MSKLLFDPDEHKYTWEDRLIASVTQVIEAKYFCDPFYADRGKKIHRMCELYKQGDLNEDDLDEQLRPYLEALKKFEREAPHVTGIGDYKGGVPALWHLLQIGAYRELWLNGIDKEGRPLREIRKGYEVQGYHPTWRYAGTVDIIDVVHDEYPTAFILYLREDSTYRLNPVQDIRKHTQSFLTLVSANFVRKEYKI